MYGPDETDPTGSMDGGWTDEGHEDEERMSGQRTALGAQPPKGPKAPGRQQPVRANGVVAQWGCTTGQGLLCAGGGTASALPVPCCAVLDSTSALDSSLLQVQHAVRLKLMTAIAGRGTAQKNGQK